jgi:hypothetical protein
MSESPVFPPDQVVHLKSRLTPEEFSVLEKAIARLEGIVSQARMKGLCYFACHPGLGSPSLPTQMRFHDINGNSMAKSMSFKREWENKIGRTYCLPDALKMSVLVESLVLSADEMMPATRASQTSKGA